MPISQTFDVNPRTVQEALYRGGYGIAEAQQYERDRTFSEGARQFDVKTALEQEAMLMQERLRQEALAQQAMEADYRFQIGQGQLGLDAQRNDLYGQQLEAQQAQDEGVTQRAMLSQMGQTVRDREKRNFDVAISQQDAITDARAKNLIDDQQFAEAAGVWQERHGIPWDFPQQMAAQQDEAAATAEIQRVKAMMVDPFTGESMIPEGAEEWFMQLEPIDKIKVAKDWKAEARQKFTARQKEKEFGIKQEEAASKIETDRELAADQNTRRWDEHDQDQEARRIKAAQDLEIKLATSLVNGLAKIDETESQWDLNNGGDPGTDAKGKKLPKPVRPDFEKQRQSLISSMERVRQMGGAAIGNAGQSQPQQSSLPKPKTAAERDALPPNTWYEAPDGSIRKR
jgi:hypothetical protein